MAELDGYFGNGINHWRDELVARRRRLLARGKTLDRISHPSAYGQQKLVEINEALIRALDRELRKALAQSAPEPMRETSE